jgi:hypothetical protein
MTNEKLKKRLNRKFEQFSGSQTNTIKQISFKRKQKNQITIFIFVINFFLYWIKLFSKKTQ